MDAWGRLETRIQAFVKDRRRMARAFLIAYWVSTVVVLLGVGIIILSALGKWRL